MRLELLEPPYAVCRLDPDSSLPEWATRSLVEPAAGVSSVTRTDQELSIIVRQSTVPAHIQQEGAWRALRVVGPLEFSLTGVLAALTAPLAAEKISVFAFSTYDTDYLLVKTDRLEQALAALAEAGHEIER